MAGLIQKKDATTKIDGYPIFIFPGRIIDLDQTKNDRTGVIKLSLLILTPFLAAAATMRTMVHPGVLISEGVTNPYNLKLQISSPKIIGDDVRKLSKTYFFAAAIKPKAYNIDGKMIETYEGFLHVIADSLKDPKLLSIFMEPEAEAEDQEINYSQLEGMLQS